MKRYGLYVRTALTQQGNESRSLKNQTLQLRKELQRRQKLGEECQEARIYIENGASGLNFNRPKFKEMLRDIDANIIDTVLCTELSRISRNTQDVMAFIKKLKSKRITCLCLAQGFIQGELS